MKQINPMEFMQMISTIEKTLESLKAMIGYTFEEIKTVLKKEMMSLMVVPDKFRYDRLEQICQDGLIFGGIISASNLKRQKCELQYYKMKGKMCYSSIPLIKTYRSLTGLGLRESKEFVDSFMAEVYQEEGGFKLIEEKSSAMHMHSVGSEGIAR